MTEQQTARLPTRSAPHVFGAAMLFGLIALVGIYAAYAAVKDFAYARASGRWPTAEGVVLSSPNGGKLLRFAYHHDGVSYEGDRIAFRTRGYIGSPPPRSPGSQVAVYFRPDDPAIAVLVPGGSGRRFAIWLALAGAAVFVGVAGLTRAMMALDFPDVVARPPRGAGAGTNGATSNASP
ncbi:MAG: DUF3592 domain-containing protein [Alphaproteobacteria bacterium]|nr:DUF3592 domain-containing protein [Alphaproteobacteria bacterium]